MWAFLLLTCFINTADLQKRPLDILSQFDSENYPTKTFSGYVEYDKNILTLSHMPVGKFPNAVMYRHQLIVTNPQQKVLLDRAEKQEKAVKVVGQITNILGKQVIVVDSVIILEFNSN